MNTVKAIFCTISVCGFRLFKLDQYRQIYSGFRDYNLKFEQVSVYARRNISGARMSICKHALAKNFSIKEMQEWLSMDLNGFVFRYIIDSRIQGIPKERVRNCIASETNLEKCFYNYNELLKQYGKKE